MIGNLIPRPIFPWTFFDLVFYVDDVREPVTVEDLEDYVKKMHSNTDHLFSEEYEVRSHDSHVTVDDVIK